MSTHDRRRAERIEVGIDAQIYTPRGFLDAKVRDLSRTGLRLRLRIDEVGLEATSDLRTAAEAIAETLAPNFALDLDYKKFGPLLQRGVMLTRILLPPEEPLFVDVCCAFDEPLDDEVTTILQADLPPIREGVPAWVPPAPTENALAGMVTMRPRDSLDERPVKLPGDAPSAKPAAAPPRHRYRALVTGTAKDAPPAFFCHTDLVTAVGVRVAVPRPTDADGVREAMGNLVKVHGKAVDLRILDESQDVWKGRARVTGVELPKDRGDAMLVTLAYARPLSMSAMRLLGLVSAA